MNGRTELRWLRRPKAVAAFVRKKLRCGKREQNLQYFGRQRQILDKKYTTGWTKKCYNLFLSELSQISTKFANFWHADGQNDRIM